MADTIAESFVGGWKSGVDLQNYGDQEKARTSILSSKAEADRMALDSAKQAAQERLAYLSGKKEVAAENPTLDPSNLDQAIKLQNFLIKKYSQTPELQAPAIKEREGLLKQQEEAIKLQGIEREQKRADLYDNLSKATVSPEVAASFTTSSDPILQHFGQILSNQKPFYFGGKQTLYKDLSIPEQKEVISRILAPVAPKIDQGMLSKQSRLEYDYWRTQEQLAADEERNRIRAQEAAAKREKIASDKTAKAAKMADKTEQMKKATDHYVKEKAATEVALVEAKDKAGWFESDSEKENIRILTEKLQGIESSYADAKRMYGAKDVATKAPKGTGTKEDPIKLD